MHLPKLSCSCSPIGTTINMIFKLNLQSVLMQSLVNQCLNIFISPIPNITVHFRVLPNQNLPTYMPVVNGIQFRILEKGKRWPHRTVCYFSPLSKYEKKPCYWLVAQLEAALLPSFHNNEYCIICSCLKMYALNISIRCKQTKP